MSYTGGMRSAAVKITHIHTVLERRAFIAWRRDLAAFMVAEGVACELEHVTEQTWLAYHQAGNDPSSAALAELARTAD